MSPKVGKRVLWKLFVYVSVLEGGLGGALGLDEGWLPLPTRPQRYCDPALLVIFDSLERNHVSNLGNT